MNDEKILFIGGSKDGKREMLPQPAGLHYQAAYFTRRDYASGYPAMPSFGITTETFEIKHFKCEDGTVLKVAVDSRVKDVMKQLVKGYRYHRRSKSKYR